MANGIHHSRMHDIHSLMNSSSFTLQFVEKRLSLVLAKSLILTVSVLCNTLINAITKQKRSRFQ